MTPVLVVHDGPHGVAAYARETAAAVRGRRPGVGIVDVAEVPRLAPGTPLHVQFTDRLWGASPEAAAEAFVGLSRRHPLSVTLHDVPQESDGERNRPRRRAAYAAVTAAATGVAVNSRHERMLLAEETVWTGDAAVVPLPVALTDAGPAPAPDGSVGVLGFFYPGKGHERALAAATEAGLDRLTVIGRASDGHADDLARFVRLGDAAGVAVEVTGYLDDADLAVRCRRIAAPVIAHEHVSASGSLATWIGLGRRPITVTNRYVREMAELRPGTVTAVERGGLSEAVRDARRDPASTWHGLSAVPAGRADAADAYLAWWDRLAW